MILYRLMLSRAYQVYPRLVQDTKLGRAPDEPNPGIIEVYCHFECSQGLLR